MDMRKTLPIFFIIAILSGSGPTRGDVACTEPVETESGLVRGTGDTETATCSWLGIPYAAPPVDELRWAAPQPHPFWSGIREATEYGAICMQKGGIITDFLNAVPDREVSEDCLFLNIWRPAKSGKFPVMVWLHGGGYTTGTGNSELYKGDRLARDGEVVVVTINYRLNVFGYFAHPALRDEDPNGSTGSYGSLDQVAAIRWVHENIEGFGGAPKNITVFGQSAGGRSVCTMVATPLTRGMFHRAILESGGCETSAPLEKGYKQARQIAASLDCDYNDINCLREVPAETLLEKGSQGMLEAGLVMVPHHDGYLLTDYPLAMIRSGNFNRVPFMGGYTKDEYRIAVLLMPRVFFGRPSKYEKILARSLGLPDEEAMRLAGLYPLSKYDNKPRDAYGQIIVDSFHGCPTTTGLSAAAERNPDVYLYRFDYDGMRLGGLIGTFHAMEIPFIFNSLDRNPVDFMYNKKNMEEAKALSRIIQGYWVNFAKTGDPNGPDLPHWPRLNAEEKKFQVLDVNTRTNVLDTADQCSFWEDYSKYLALPFESMHLEE